jgi:hypothetical protein
VRKRRAGLAQAEKGLNLAVISVMNLVIILTAGRGGAIEVCDLVGCELSCRARSHCGSGEGTFERWEGLTAQASFGA